MMSKVIWLLLVGLALLLPTSSSQAKKKKAVKQIVIEEVTRVEGKIQKPEVWYLLPRSNLKFDASKKHQKLAPKIEEATNKGPF